MRTKKTKRPTIPITVLTELWARSAGRCEFRGCNKILYRDELTQERSNLGIVSHIVAFSPDGPRGDVIRSSQLEKDIKNLMLTCREHGKLIDDKAQENVYTEEVLLEHKREHEERIKFLTSHAKQYQTHLLIIQAPIDGLYIKIDPSEIYAAIYPYYPNSEIPTYIDLSSLRTVTEGLEKFNLMAEQITNDIQDIFKQLARIGNTSSLSIFAIAPIPLLVHLGYCIGNFHRIELYQRHHDTKDWCWKEDNNNDLLFYKVTHPSSINDAQPTALVFSISGIVSREHISKVLGGEPNIYEIQASEPSRLFLRSKKQLEIFHYELQKIISALGWAYAKRQTIHVFLALPSPFAIEFGRCIKSLDTPFIIYEYINSKHTYEAAFFINNVC